MGRDRTTSDLFSVASSGGSSPGQERPHLLPKDLPNAVKHLNDEELDRLLTAASLRPNGGTDHSERSTFSNASAERGYRLIDTWAAKRRSRCFQGWRHACADCPTVRLIRIQTCGKLWRARHRSDEGSTNPAKGVQVENPPCSEAFLWQATLCIFATLSSLWVLADFTCRGETREGQVHRGPDPETRTCPHRPDTPQQERLSCRRAGSQ